MTDEPQSTASDHLRSIRVVAWPAFRNRSYQPYNHLLYSALANGDTRVHEFSDWRNLIRRCDVFHFHWPDSFLARSSTLGGAARNATVRAYIRRVRARGGVVVWTVHNARPNSEVGREQAAEFYAWLLDHVDGLIYHNPRTADAMLAELGLRVPADRPTLLVPHGHYADAYPAPGESAAECRRYFGLDPERRTVLLFGHIRRYKNYEHAMDIVEQSPDDWQFVIAGRARDPAYLDVLRARANGMDNVHVHARVIPDHEVGRLFTASDVVLAPYRQPLNSGVAVLALTFNRPVVMTAGYGADGLRYWHGEGMLRAVPADADLHEWVQALREADANDVGDVVRSETFSWESIARRTREFYIRLLRGGTGS